MMNARIDKGIAAAMKSGTDIGRMRRGWFAFAASLWILRQQESTSHVEISERVMLII